jgi:hypothetical protein
VVPAHTTAVPLWPPAKPKLAGPAPATAANFWFPTAPTYDRDMAARRAGPGLAKTRSQPWLRTRTIELWEAGDYRWRVLFEGADVMSEGATRSESDGLVYYGSTSVILPRVSRGGLMPDAECERVARALLADPHARIRAIRIAYLEAQLRAGGPIGRLAAEVNVRPDERGLRIDVEVEARVLSARESARVASAAPHRSRAPTRRR